MDKIGQLIREALEHLFNKAILSKDSAKTKSKK